MHVHIGVLEFFVWALYYLIFKAIVLLVNIEARRNKWHVPSAVSGLFS